MSLRIRLMPPPPFPSRPARGTSFWWLSSQATARIIPARLLRHPDCLGPEWRKMFWVVTAIRKYGRHTLSSQLSGVTVSADNPCSSYNNTLLHVVSFTGAASAVGATSTPAVGTGSGYASTSLHAVNNSWVRAVWRRVGLLQSPHARNRPDYYPELGRSR